MSNASGKCECELCCDGEHAGVLEEGCIQLDCERDLDHEDDLDETRERERRCWQGEWLPVIDRVERWARRHVRVAPAPCAQEAPHA